MRVQPTPTFRDRVAAQAYATTPLPAAEAATVLAHCEYMLQQRGHLYDFEQALLLRVAKFQ